MTKKYNLLDLLIVVLTCIAIGLCIVYIYSEINKDLAEQVDYYKEMYHEKDGAVRLLQERYGVE